MTYWQISINGLHRGYVAAPDRRAAAAKLAR